MRLADALRKKVENHENKIQEKAKIELEKKEAALEEFIEVVGTKIKQIRENFKDFQLDLEEMAESGQGSYKVLSVTELCNDKIREYERQDSRFGNPLFRDSKIKKYIEENIVDEFIKKSDALLEFISSLKGDGFTTSFTGDKHLEIKWSEVEKLEETYSY